MSQSRRSAYSCRVGSRPRKHAVRRQLGHARAMTCLGIKLDSLKGNRLGHTLQTTALVHEAYLRLGQSRSFIDETHFLRASALAMRHAVINHAQSRLAEKRGGQHLTLSHVADLSVDSDEGMLALNEAMERLAKEMPRWPIWSSAVSSAATARRTRRGRSACRCASCSAIGSKHGRGCSASSAGRWASDATTIESEWREPGRVAV